MRNQTVPSITQFALSLPEDLSALADDDLAGLLAQATSEFDALFDAGDDAPTAEQLTEMETLAAQFRAVSAESARRETEASARAEQLRVLAETVHPAAPVEPAAAEDPAVEGEPAVVAAAAAPVDPPAVRPSLGDARRVAPPLPRPLARSAEQGRSVMIASAGATEFTSGQEITLLDAARILDQRRSALPRPGTQGRHAVHIASVRTSYPEALTASAFDADEVMAYAADESRLEGGSLTAAGTGWCSPSETVYDVTGDGSTVEGTISVPDIHVTRGGIRFTKGVDFASVYTDGFSQTEAQNIAGDTKSIVNVPCPDFEEVRLEAIGLAVKSGVLQQVGFPESIAQFMAQSLIAHEHRVSAKTITKMLAGCTNVGTVGSAFAGSLQLLESLELVVEDMRYRHVSARSETIEAVLPYWVRGLVRADYARRNGISNPMELTDAQIDSWFTIRKIAPQYTYDWQSKLTGLTGGPGHSVPITAYPAAVDVMLYRAGTFVRGREDVITINGLYDSALLVKNEQLALFTEQSILVAKRGHDARKVTIPLAIDGASGAQGFTVPETP